MNTFMCLHSNYQRALYLECTECVRSITLAKMRHAKLKMSQKCSINEFKIFHFWEIFTNIAQSFFLIIQIDDSD